MPGSGFRGYGWPPSDHGTHHGVRQGLPAPAETVAAAMSPRRCTRHHAPHPRCWRFPGTAPVRCRPGPSRDIPAVRFRHAGAVDEPGRLQVRQGSSRFFPASEIAGPSCILVGAAPAPRSAARRFPVHRMSLAYGGQNSYINTGLMITIENPGAHCRSHQGARGLGPARPSRVHLTPICE